MQVYICAAGKGTRIAEVTQGVVPKPLLLLDEKAILDYILEMLYNTRKIDEINLILGHNELAFKKRYGSKFNGVDINYHFNNKYADSGNLYSLYCAKDSMSDDLIYMTADLIIAPQLVENFILREDRGNKVLSDSRLEVLRNDVVKLKENDLGIYEISKKIQPEIATGSGVGLYRLSGKESVKSFFQISKKIFEERGLQQGFIEPIPYMLEEYPWKTSNYVEYTWFDVDDKSDYIKAQNVIKELYKPLKHSQNGK